MDKKKKEPKKIEGKTSKKKINSLCDGDKDLSTVETTKLIPITWREGNGNLKIGTLRNDSEDVISELRELKEIPSERKGDGKLQTGVCRETLFDYGGQNHERKGKKTKKEGERDA